MSLTLRWVDESESERVVRTRLRCYGSASKEFERFRERYDKDHRAGTGDYLLAEEAGEAVGTATHYPMTLWARGSSFTCQGVAWVGAIRTMRRRGKGTPGVASTVMHEMLKHARDRGDVLSALMPFRASYYEHFGYGIVERRCEWTVPLSTLPTGEFDGIRFYEPSDFQARFDGYLAAIQSGQCDVERTEAFWRKNLGSAGDGFEVIDRPDSAGPIRGAMLLTSAQLTGKDHLKVTEHWYADIAALKRQLNFLSSLRDQFSSVQITLPVDVKLNWLLKESQIPHRPVNHAVAEARPFTRMQVRVLQHATFLSGLHVPNDAKGTAVVSIAETEGHSTKVKIDIDGGRISAADSNASADFECTDRVWAAVACGNLSASEARMLELATGSDKAVACLDALSRGPLPFCHEHF